MKLQVLGSSSDGNCYLLTSTNGETLIIEAGISFKEVKKSLNYVLGGLVGCLVSHEHFDHAGKLSDYLKVGIETWSCLSVKAKYSEVHEFHGEIVKLGEFTIQAFCLDHDVECVGFLVDHTEMGRLLFITDTNKCTSKYGSMYKFKNVNHFMIEANYDDDILYENVFKGLLSVSQAERTSQTHLSIRDVKRFLSINRSRSIRNIVLLHLSNNNSKASAFTREIKQYLGLDNVYIADAGLELAINKDSY